MDASTRDPEAFQAVRQSGAIGTVRCVTLRAADKPGELRTALLVGQYRVELKGSDGLAETVTPFAIGDLGDGGTYHQLCLDVDGTPTKVSFPTGYVTDPNEDLNPDTEVAVTQ